MFISKSRADMIIFYGSYFYLFTKHKSYENINIIKVWYGTVPCRTYYLSDNSPDR